MTVAGSLWSVPSAEQLDEALRLQESGLTRLHWDFSDGVFAAAGGFSAPQAQLLSRHTSMSAEVHLMATHTLSLVDAWSDFCDRIAVHIESEDWKESVTRIEQRGARPCLAVSPETPWDSLPKEFDLLVMSITPGQAGSSFNRASLDKVRHLSLAEPNRQIGLDGGVTSDVAPDAKEAGATWLVVGTDLFRPGGAERWSGLFEAVPNIR